MTVLQPQPAPSPESPPLRTFLPPVLRPASITDFLPFSQASDLINALSFSVVHSSPSQISYWSIRISIDYSSDFQPNARTYLKIQGNILNRISKLLRSKNLPVNSLWAREKAGYGQHTHLIIQFPFELVQTISNLIYRTGDLNDRTNNTAVHITPKNCKGETCRFGMRTLKAVKSNIFHLLKTISPKSLVDGTPVLAALGIDHRTPCTIHGKRSGVSASIEKAARAKAGWKEATTISELSTMMRSF